LISCATVLSVAGVAGSTAAGAASTTTTTVATPLRLPKSGKCTILEIGDSLGTDLGGGLSHQLEKSPKIRLILEGKSSTGLSNSGFYNWPQHLKTFLAQYHPQLTILLLGGNDEQGIIVNGRAAAFDTTPWRKQYAKNVAAMMDETTKAGSAVLWIGMPIMYPNGYRQGIQVINSIFAKVAKAKQRVTFLPTWKFFANSKGQFRFSAMVDGVQQAIRTSDGIHPTAVGQNVLATYVVQELKILYGLSVKPAYPEIFTSKSAR
jgi:hypothetical protein